MRYHRLCLATSQRSLFHEPLAQLTTERRGVKSRTWSYSLYCDCECRQIPIVPIQIAFCWEKCMWKWSILFHPYWSIISYVMENHKVHKKRCSEAVFRRRTMPVTGSPALHMVQTTPVHSSYGLALSNGGTLHDSFFSSLCLSCRSAL